MYFQIAEIKEFLKNAADAVKIAFDLDVFILDCNFDEILSTFLKKGYKFNICKKIIPHDILSKASFYYIDENKTSDTCFSCADNANCSIKSAAFSPIVKSENVIGVIGCLTCSFEQKNNLHLNIEKYKKFIYKISALIESKILFNKDPDSVSISDVDSAIKLAFAKLKGNSDELKKVINFASKVAFSSSTILLTGESGTGKELFAKSIHDCSPRKNNPFVAVNCSSIPDNLLESELFGYDEGAFTGSKKSGKKGKFELANSGTIFLDEIGDMDFNLQAKILRVLEEHEIERLGSNETVKLDIRVISATNKKLDEMVEKGLFREDLYYRLNVIPIQLPPLRSRKSDIKILINHFLDKYNKELSKNILGIDTYALEILADYDWPGNIRELSNVIEYTMHMEIDDYIHYNSLPSKIINYVRNPSKNSPSAAYQVSSANKIKPDEYNEIIDAVEMFGNTTEGKKKAAKYLNMSLSTLYRKLAQYDV